MRATRPTALLVFVLSATAIAHSQTCADQLRATASTTGGQIVSARELQIPPGAWQHFEKARAAAERNRPDILERETARALAIAPRFAEVYLLRAARAIAGGQYEAALDLVATARVLDPDLRWSGVLVASALNQLRRYDEAAAELDHTRGAEAASWQASYEHARAESGRRDIPAALHWSDLAIAAAPVGCTEARLVRANVLQFAGRRSEVDTELETYLAQDRVGTRRADVFQALDKVRRSTPAADSNLLTDEVARSK